MEAIIAEEIKYFHEALESHNGHPIDIQNQLRQSISNVATHITFGNRFNYDNEQLENLQTDVFFSKYFLTESLPLLRVSIILLTLSLKFQRKTQHCQR